MREQEHMQRSLLEILEIKIISIEINSGLDLIKERISELKDYLQKNNRLTANIMSETMHTKKTIELLLNIMDKYKHHPLL